MHSFHGAPGISAIDHGPAGGLLTGISSDHIGALLAPLFVPAAIWLFLAIARKASAAGFPPAARLLCALNVSSFRQRVVAVLLLVTAFIHFALVPGHLHASPGLAWLFAIDGLLFVTATVGGLTVSWWRPAAATLLLLTVLAYLIAIAARQESVDQLGIGTTLVELAALGLVLVPSGDGAGTRGRTLPRTAAAAFLVVATLLTGVVIWIAELRPRAVTAADAAQAEHGATGEQGANALTGLVMQPAPARPPTPQEQAAADRLAAETKAGIARYQDVRVALAAGYRPTTPPNLPLVHYGNKANMHDGRLLDPTRPEALVYASTSRGPVLMGAVYMTEKLWQPAPDPAGPLIRWHRHASVCVAPNATLAGFLSPFGNCPAGTVNVLTPAMLHVWTATERPRIGGEAPPVPVD